MSNAKQRLRKSESPFVWDDGDGLDDPARPWWSLLKPDWWNGSTDYMLKRSLSLFVHGIRSASPNAQPDILATVENLLRLDDLRPVQIEELEADIVAGIELGQVPDMILQLLWDAFSWGLPEWTMPQGMTLSDFQSNVEEHLRRDILGLGLDSDSDR